MGREDKVRERVGSAFLVYLSACRPFVRWGKFELWIIYIVWNSHSSCVLADEAQAGVSMWVTVNETFRAEFRTGFLLTHRPSLHKARSLLVKLPILLSTVSQAVNSQGPHCWKLLHLPRCLCLPVNICSYGPQCTTHICGCVHVSDAVDKLKWIILKNNQKSTPAWVLLVIQNKSLCALLELKTKWDTVKPRAFSLRLYIYLRRCTAHSHLGASQYKTTVGCWAAIRDQLGFQLLAQGACFKRKE